MGWGVEKLAKYGAGTGGICARIISSKFNRMLTIGQGVLVGSSRAAFLFSGRF